ncbi:MAG: hypothetical protein HFJ27_01745 [Clostridia bacterium]|nr:hypothetical protein [Clostridia bacterium]
MKIHFHTIKLNYKLIGCCFILLLVLPCVFVYTLATTPLQEEGINVPIIMYHSILKDTSKSRKLYYYS